MKKIKYFLCAFVLLSIVWSCTNDDFGTIDFVGSANAPTNVSALYNITQDNTGLVTITPNSEGAVSYDIYFGDNTTAPVNVLQGQNVSHIYGEKVYAVKIVAIGITGLKTEVSQNLTVSFKAPTNLVVDIKNDLAVSKKVNVKATANFATMFDVYFGEPGNDLPVSANIGETASYIYKNPGTYNIRVVAKSAAIKTTEQTQSFVVTEILQPTTAAPTPPARAASDVTSIYSDSYTNVSVSEWNPDWGQSTKLYTYDIAGNKMLHYVNLNYSGIVTDYGNPTNLSDKTFVHFDYWTSDAKSLAFKIVNTSRPDGPTKESEVAVSPIELGKWVSVTIPLSSFTTNMSAITQMLFVSSNANVFIDNLYFYKAPTPASGLAGTWKIASEPGALKVGPSSGSGEWWTSDAQTVIDRACYFDDTYVFGSSGSFSNLLGSSTWLEKWQGVSAESCGTPVAPHNGSAAATYLYDKTAGTITVTGTGAYLGLPKVNNSGELPNVGVPSSIVYNAVLSDNNNTLNVVVESGSGVFWSYKLVRVN